MRRSVVYVATEVHPFTKVGGLADVAGAFPAELARRGWGVTVIHPNCRESRPGTLSGLEKTESTVPVGGRDVEIDEYRGWQDVLLVRVSCEEELAEGVPLYGTGEQRDQNRFSLFSEACLHWIRKHGKAPDVIHCNDWHTAFIPYAIRQPDWKGLFQSTATVLTIHNLAYQGPQTSDPSAGTSLTVLGRGLEHADCVNTVSKTYARDITQEPFGEGLDHVLSRLQKEGRLFGILNGVDYEDFDPSTDKHVEARFDSDCIEKRLQNKEVLQTESGLPADGSVPLLGMVARIEKQKGIDLMLMSIDEILKRDVQLAMMGVGNECHVSALEGYNKHRNFRFHRVSAEQMARRFYAGCDMILCPSIFEPCGLTALIALRYGAVPVVRDTGGYSETIQESSGHPGEGVGFTFEKEDPKDFVSAIERALSLYSDPVQWREFQRRGMASRFSWEAAVDQYLTLYDVAGKLLTLPRGPPWDLTEDPYSDMAL